MTDRHKHSSCAPLRENGERAPAGGGRSSPNDPKAPNPPRHALPLVAIAAAIALVPSALNASPQVIRGTQTATESPQVVRGAQTANDLMNLAKRHEHGVGAVQDLDRAIQLYCDAAEQGNVEAGYHLGWIYATGRAGEIDEVLAAAWFKEAAANKHPQAEQKIRALGAADLDLGQGPDCVLRW